MRQLVFVAALFAATHTHAHDTRAAYLGNEGVLVAAGDDKVLFDAFYAESYGTYALVPDDIAEALLAGASPYDGVDAVFVSHVHGDHFSAAPAIKYLRAHGNVQLYGSPQVKEAFLTEGLDADDPLLARIHVVDIAPGAPPAVFSVGGIDVEAFAIPHAGGARMADIRNIAFRVTIEALDGSVIHLGDAGTVDEDFAPYQDDFDAKPHALALPPYWFFLDPAGRAIIDERLRPAQAVGIHVPAEAAGNGNQWRTEAGADLFTDPGEHRVLSPATKR